LLPFPLCPFMEPVLPDWPGVVAVPLSVPMLPPLLPA
jgi:hypothetical protein